MFFYLDIGIQFQFQKHMGESVRHALFVERNWKMLAIVSCLILLAFKAYK